MSGAVSPSSNRSYGVKRVCEVWGVSRSGLYAWRKRVAEGRAPGRRGPKPVVSDAEMTDIIRELLKQVEEELGFRGEGYRKVWARLRSRQHSIAKRRVNRLMREAGLLAPTRMGPARGPSVHDGTIITETPNTMWGTDATQVWTREEGLVWVFAAVDHCTAELVGTHASKRGSRHEALVPVQQGVRERFGGCDQGAAGGLSLRHDHGSQYMARDFQRELSFLGIESSPSFVRAPEGNGLAERCMRTLKEQVLWVRNFKNAEEVRQALDKFRRAYNASWLLTRHGYRTPSEVYAEKVAA